MFTSPLVTASAACLPLPRSRLPLAMFPHLLPDPILIHALSTRKGLRYKCWPDSEGVLPTFLTQSFASLETWPPKADYTLQS